MAMLGNFEQGLPMSWLSFFFGSLARAGDNDGRMRVRDSKEMTYQSFNLYFLDAFTCFYYSCHGRCLSAVVVLVA
jgi:hypothetical protein